MSYSHLMIVGDFNLPQIDWEVETSTAPDNHLSHAFLETIHESFLFQHVHCPTRFRLGETPNVLDLVFTNEEGMVRDLDYLPGLDRSDHVVLKFTLICFADEDESRRPLVTRTNFERLSRVLRSLNWQEVGNKELEEAYETFKTNITNAVDGCSAKRGAHSKKNLYMNRAALQIRKRKKELWSKYRRTRDILDHARFVRCRNELRALTRKLRKDHEAKLVGDIKKNPKAFWRYANSRLRTRCRVEDLLDENGELTTRNEEKAEVLSRFFSSVFTEEGPEASPTLTCDYQGPHLVDVHQMSRHSRLRES